MVCYHFQDVILLAENVDKDIGELFTFDEMFTKEYQPNGFTAKWLGGESCFVIVVCDFCNKWKTHKMENKVMKVGYGQD